MLSIVIFIFCSYAFIALAALLFAYSGAIAGIICGFWSLFRASSGKPAASCDDPEARQLRRVRNLDNFLGIRPKH